MRKNKKIMFMLGIFISIIIILGLYALSGLIIWGVVNLFLLIFNIEFNFTYLMALVVELILIIFGSYF